VFLHGDLGGDAPHRVDKIDVQTVVEVFSLQGTVSSHSRLAAEEAGKKISQVAEPPRPKIHPAKIETAKPGARLRTSRRSGETVMAELIVLAALLRVAQDLVGLAQILELPLRRLVSWVDVGMVTPRQLPVRALDLVLRGATTQTEHLIVIPLCHASLSPATRRLARHAASMGTCRG